MSVFTPVMSSLSPHLRRAGLLAASCLGLGACTGDYYGDGYYGASYGGGYSSYDGYCDGYDSYDSYYGCDNRYGYGNIGYGGGYYNNYYYPGYGVYIFDRGGRRYTMNDDYRRYWGQRRWEWRRNNRGNDWRGNDGRGRDWRDRDGRDRDGRDRDGRDWNGRDNDGRDRDGGDRDGRDRDGRGNWNGNNRPDAQPGRGRPDGVVTQPVRPPRATPGRAPRNDRANIGRPRGNPIPGARTPATMTPRAERAPRAAAAAPNVVQQAPAAAAPRVERAQRPERAPRLREGRGRQAPDQQ